MKLIIQGLEAVGLFDGNTINAISEIAEVAASDRVKEQRTELEALIKESVGKLPTEQNTINAAQFVPYTSFSLDNTENLRKLFAHANKVVLDQFERNFEHLKRIGIDDNWANNAASAHSGAVLYFPPGYYRCSQTLDIAPQLSVRGCYGQSQLAFEGEYPKAPAGDFIRTWSGYPRNNEMPIFLNAPGRVVNGEMRMVSHQQTFEGLRIISRKGIAIATMGTKNNFRIRKIVFNGGMLGSAGGDSCAVLARPLEEYEFQGGWSTQQSDAFNTDGEIVDCHIEGFTHGIAGAFGYAPFIARNHFHYCPVAMFLSNLHFGKVCDNFIGFTLDWQKRMRDKGQPGAAVAIATNARNSLFSGNQVVEYEGAILLEGGGNVIRGNMQSSSSTSARMIRVVPKWWKSDGSEKDALVEQGRNLGGPVHPGTDNVVAENVMDGPGAIIESPQGTNIWRNNNYKL